MTKFTVTHPMQLLRHLRHFNQLNQHLLLLPWKLLTHMVKRRFPQLLLRLHQAQQHRLPLLMQIPISQIGFKMQMGIGGRRMRKDIGGAWARMANGTQPIAQGINEVC